MSLSLTGRVAVVTGAGRGLGRAFALDLARHGARVVVNDLGVDLNGRGGDASVAQAVVDEIAGAGGEAVPHTGSVASHEDAYALVKTAMDTWGRLDIVVSNAGFLRDQAIHNMSEDDWNAVLGTHLTGAYNVLHHAWPVFRQQRHGRAILVTSGAGFLGNFGQANYGSAKSGLIGLMQVLKLEGLKYGVTVNCLAPAAATRMTMSAGKDGTEMMQNAPERVAPLVTWLASPECTSTGLIVGARGGRYYRAAMVRAPGVELDDPTADDIAAHWDSITSLEGAEPWWDISTTWAEHERARQQ